MSEQEIREQILADLEAFIKAQSEAPYCQPFDLIDIKNIIRGKKIYPYKYKFDMLLARSRQIGDRYLQPHGKTFVYLEDLELAIKELTDEK